MSTKQLPKTFSKRGWIFTELKRDESGTVRLYSQLKRETYYPSAYVVARIGTSKPPEAWGSEYDLHEVFPSDEQWGRNGWTIPDFDKAESKFAEICSAVAKRDSVKEVKQ